MSKRLTLSIILAIITFIITFSILALWYYDITLPLWARVLIGYAGLMIFSSTLATIYFERKYQKAENGIFTIIVYTIIILLSPILAFFWVALSNWAVNDEYQKHRVEYTRAEHLERRMKHFEEHYKKHAPKSYEKAKQAW